jgi:heat shock protein HslJ
MSKIRIVAAVLASGVLGACAASPGTPLQLGGTQWTLASADSGPLAPFAATSGVTLQFEGDRLAGYGGCNQYSGPYTLEGSKLSAGPVAATKRGCMGDGNTIERAWFEVLAAPMQVERDGDALVLTASDGAKLRFDAGAKSR